ncbi:MAG: CpaF family protein [Lachnospiraceae bacterium]|nr:CpaF family protein [Lachnospiraceae bacterium]
MHRDELTEKYKKTVMDELDISRDLADETLLTGIDRVLVREQALSVAEKLSLRKDIFDSFRRLDVLQTLVEDGDVTEIMVNGSRNIFYEKEGVIRRWDRCFSGQDRLEDVIQQIVAGVNRRVNTASPIVDARLPDGSRVNVVLPPIAPEGPIVTIRRFPGEAMTMDRLTGLGSLDRGTADFLEERVREGSNIFISGGTGSGKTTFLNALSGAIPQDERVITIEDSLELQLAMPDLVRLEARDVNSEGEGRITIRDLIRTALRMRPDRLIVGEVRGPEALDMLQAMNTGHDGSLSTGHANSAADMLSRLETMVLMGGELPLYAIRAQIASALDLMVHLARLRNGRRVVVSIQEVTGYENDRIGLRELYVREGEKLVQRERFLGDKRRG